MPGVDVNITNAPAPASRPTETGKLFCAAVLERGSTSKPITVHSISELKAKTGEAVAGSFLVAGAEEFFQEGGNTLILGRVVGSAAKAASHTLSDSEAKKVLKVSAQSTGTWGNNVTIKITNKTTTFDLEVLLSGTLKETKTGLTSLQEAVEWSTTESEYVTIALDEAGSLPATIASQVLEGGSNGEAVDEDDYAIALELFSPDFGAGQVNCDGQTGTIVQEALMAHSEAHARTGLIDFPVGATKTELESLALGLRKKEGARRSAGFSTWAVIPGLAPNTTRRVPWSFVQAGILGRNDAAQSPPRVNEASAGVNGKPRNVQSLVTEFNRKERDELDAARVIAIRNVPVEGLETYGNVTLVSPEAEPAWEALTAARLFMFVESEGEAILEKYVFKEIDPHGLLFQEAGGALQAFLETLGNQMFNNPSEAVNVSGQVNTKETIKHKQLNASIRVQPSPSADTVTLNITAEGV